MRISARRIRNTCVVLGALAMGGGVAAQDTARSPSPVFVGSEAENYLRYLQSLDEIPFHQWSMRGFSDADMRQLRVGSAPSVWAAWPVKSSGRSLLGRVQFVPASGSVIYNTLTPYGLNDGPTWAGRGLTVELSGGVTAKWGPLRATLAPTAFWAENRAFAMVPVPDTTHPFADALHPTAVDRPQRFGNSAYGRVDPGQSGLTIEGLGAQIGFSWANRWWGPMSEFPYVLGNNAAGFPHLHFGTASPRNIWIGRLSAMVLYGRLDQSQYSPVDSGPRGRFASGMALVLEPKPFPGLEIGAVRFFHATWPDSGITSVYFAHLFETFIKARISKIFAPAGRTEERISGDNQLASAFARWVLPHSGVELYAEYGREDHNWDGRDLMVELDHTATVGYGVRKAWRSPSGLRALRFESMNHQESTLQRHRGQGGVYYHGFTRQGHTQIGQLMGTGVAVGNGAAASVTYEQFSELATKVSWSRFTTLDLGVSPNQDARHVFRYERATRQGGGSFSVAASAIADFNHNLTGATVMSFRLECEWKRF